MCVWDQKRRIYKNYNYSQTGINFIYLCSLILCKSYCNGNFPFFLRKMQWKLSDCTSDLKRSHMTTAFMQQALPSTVLSHSNSNYASTINVGTWEMSLQFFLQLLLDEFLRVGCNFICLVAEYKHRNLFLHYSCLCQNVIQVPAKSK
jgi:hypothetical protein